MSELTKFLIKNNLVNETYTDYLVRQPKNGLSGNEKNFLISVLLKDSEGLKKIKVLNQSKINEIFLKLSDYHFSVDNFFNEEIYDYFNKAFAEKNEINAKDMEDYFKKIIFLQDMNDPEKMTLNLNSISRILYKKLESPNEDHLFSKMEDCILNNKISDSRKNDTNLLQIIVNKKTRLNINFNLDSGIEGLLNRMYNISEETDKQLLEQKLLNLIGEKINNIDSKIVRLFKHTNFNNLSLERKNFYKNLWKNGKISFNSLTFLSILSILEDKKLNSYKDIYDKLDTKDAKNCIIRNLHATEIVFDYANDYSQHESDISYLTSNINSFKSITEAYKNQEYTKDTKISFKLFNPHILWEELTNVRSEISREHYKEILNTLDKDFITEQLNKSSISLITFENMLENYKELFSNKINIKTLESNEMESLVQIPKKRSKRKTDNRNDKKNKLIKYINQHSKIDDIDEKVINEYQARDLLSIKDSINNIELYIKILNKRKLSAKNSKNKIEKLITELETKNGLPSTM